MSALSAFLTNTEERGALLGGGESGTVNYGGVHTGDNNADEENNIPDSNSIEPQNENTPDASAEVENAPPEPFDEIDGPQQQETDRDSMIERLTRRLRCLFSAITWPIVPLGTLVSLCLIWVLYAAFVEDLKSSCSHPLHAFALVSMCFLVYAPYHAQIRTHLFRYSRDRDGPIRPTRVRLYDQLFHTLCILYVYGGVTLMQSCNQDFGEQHHGDTNTSKNNNDSGTLLLLRTSSSTTGISNTCDATCPHLYAALDVYVTMLELFTLSLILPLLFLPCIYLWILRRASSEAEHLWEASLDDPGGNDLFGGGRPRITAAELMQSLETVKLIRHEDNTLVMQSLTNNRLLLNDSNSSNNDDSSENIVKDCCICMSDFSIQDERPNNDEESQEQLPLQSDNNAIVRTKCGHVFHTACLGNWIGGRWDPSASDEANRRRARRTCCPLCREDLQPATTRRSSTVAQGTTTGTNETTAAAAQ